MSREAIAAVLARDDLASGERLVALSLASFAGRDNRAWPGAPAAAARAGLRRSRYQEARDQLVRRGLVDVDVRATGRGRASTVSLVFANQGPWWEGEINVELLEAVLGYSQATGPARLLLATLAAIADESGTVRNLATADLCTAAGITDKTYRQARRTLVSSGQIGLVSSGVGGRGNTNVWVVPDPRLRDGALPARLATRMAPPVGARPLVAMSRSDVTAAAVAPQHSSSGVKGGQGRTASDENCPAPTGVSAVKGGQDRTLFDQTPAETPAKTPAPNVRAGKEPQNPRTREDPPNPPEGGSPPDSILIEQTYVTERGRKRRRLVRVDLGEVRRGLGLPTSGDRGDWGRGRALLRDAVGESTFEIWLDQVELIAVDVSGALVLAVNEQSASWVRERFGRLLSRCVERTGRKFRFASEPECRALEQQDQWQPAEVRALRTDQKEAS